jgi:enoyl-CoA hydratase/carnithine racemase
VRRLHEFLVEDRRDHVAVLRIDREAALGALSRGLVTAIGDYLDELRADDSTRVLVLTGTGRGFIAGADIREYDGVSQADFDSYQRLSRTVFTALETLPQITIAAVNGYALGGGFEVALSCDLIIASDRAKFGLPEVRLGLLPGGGGTQRLARAAGVRFATEVVVTGRSLSAQELQSRGIVGQIHPGTVLLDRALELAEEIAAGAPVAVTAAKQLIRDTVGLPLADGLTAEQAVLSRLFATVDAAEGIRAFIDKRQPTFVGR